MPTYILTIFFSLAATLSLYRQAASPGRISFSMEIPEEEAPRIVKWEKLARLLHTPDDTVYVINFWATFCKPCVAELPHFDRLQQLYRHKKVRVLLVSMDFAKEFENRVVPFIRNRGITSDVWLLNEPDAEKWIGQVNPAWNGAIPATVFIDPSRGDRKFFNREFKMNELLGEFKEFYQKSASDE